MKRKSVFSLIFILAFSLVLVPLVNSDCIELKHDNGIAQTSISASVGHQFGVKFTLPARKAELVKARFLISTQAPTNFMVHIYDLEGNYLISPSVVSVPAPVLSDWIDVPLNVVVNSDFFIVLEHVIEYSPFINIDSSPNQGHSFERSDSTSPWGSIDLINNLMIRAVICYSPVGGALLPNNILTIRTGIITTISIIGISAGIAYKKHAH
jgi:hypothetical protein